MGCIAAVPWNEALEEPNAVWLEDPVIGKLCSGSIATTSEVELLLLELIERPSDSLAANLVC